MIIITSPSPSHHAFTNYPLHYHSHRTITTPTTAHSQASRATGIPRKQINACCLGQRPHAGDYRWVSIASAEGGVNNGIPSGGDIDPPSRSHSTATAAGSAAAVIATTTTRRRRGMANAGTRFHRKQPSSRYVDSDDDNEEDEEDEEEEEGDWGGSNAQGGWMRVGWKV